MVNWNPGRGSEQAGMRPSLVIQTDAANQNANYPNTIVATISSSGRTVPSHVRIEATPQNGLDHASYVKCEQIMTISKDRLSTRKGSISPADMERVAQALKAVLTLP